MSTPSDSQLHPAIVRIRSALKDQNFTSGTCKVPIEQCDLYYRSSATSPLANTLNLAKATNEQLEKLIAACDAAPFGRGSQTVMDDSYRKALKLDLSQFSMPFELAATNILHQVQRDLVESHAALRRVIRAEPYKLNVYDKGAFFKAHKDTPRNSNMFGSLVIVFPTAHEGGTLVLSGEGEGEQWSFDAPELLEGSTPEAPEIAFVAFFSDVTHEVLPVSSGARITLTYNLFYEDIPSTAPAKSPKHTAVMDSVKELIDDPEIFPQGGILGFGLAHQYALERHGNICYDLSELAGYLKGSDALVYNVCRGLGLDVQLKTFYGDDRRRLYAADNFLADKDESKIEKEYLYRKMMRIDAAGLKEKGDSLVWVTERTSKTGLYSLYLAYGNEASVDYTYGALWLAVKRPATKA